MNRILYTLLGLLLLGLSTPVEAGNPDRQGEAGAAQLLINPWARSAGLHSMTTANVKGVEAMRINVAGLSRINKTEFALGHTRYLEGADISINSFGFAQRMGKSGALGVSLMAMDFGDINVTTENNPQGTGATFSPRWINIGFSYAHTFENKISVGITFRGVSESIADLNAFGFAIDAGVQYVTGAEENFKFGIALRNVGTRMSYRGQGLAENLNNPQNEQIPYQLSYFQRAQQFELPSALYIGLSYDFYADKRHRITALGNFTANSFSQDQIGGGLEYSFNELFSLRAAYRIDFGETSDGTEVGDNVETGLAAGASLEVPMKKGSTNRLGIDYAYRATNPWNGIHNITVRISL